MSIQSELKKLTSSVTDAVTFQIICVGTNGTGKTTFCKKLIEQQIRGGGRALIISPDASDWQGVPEIKVSEIRKFTGIVKIIFTLETFKELQNYSDGLLVFDDCRAYLSPNLKAGLETLFVRRRQRKLNIVAVGHGFSKIPPGFFAYSTHLVLFKTTDNVDARKDVIPVFDKVKLGVQTVNAMAERNDYFYKILKF